MATLENRIDKLESDIKRRIDGPPRVEWISIIDPDGEWVSQRWNLVTGVREIYDREGNLTEIHERKK